MYDIPCVSDMHPHKKQHYILLCVSQLKAWEEHQACWETLKVELEQRVEDGEDKADKLDKYDTI